MPTFVFGLPLHVFVVHAVVVLVPLAILGAALVAFWPAVCRTYGRLVVALTAIATLSIPIATSAGESLRDRLPTTELIRKHAELGDELLVFVLGMLITVTAIVVLDHYSRHGTGGNGAIGEESIPSGWAVGTLTRAQELLTQTATAKRSGSLSMILAVATVALAAVSAIQVVRIGDSGARAAWSNTHYVAPQHERGE